jgi:hypothetical protein
VTAEVEQQRLRKGPATAARRSRSPTQPPTDERETGYGAGEQPGIEPAFQAYLHSRKSLANAFRGRARSDKQAYEYAVQRYEVYERAVEQAVKDREMAERDALIAYAETLALAGERASAEYHQRMKQALKECRQTVEQAWRGAEDTSGTVTCVFAGDEGVGPQNRTLFNRPSRPRTVAVSVLGRLNAFAARLSAVARAGSTSGSNGVRLWKGRLLRGIGVIGGSVRRRSLELGDGLLYVARRAGKGMGRAFHRTPDSRDASDRPT